MASTPQYAGIPRCGIVQLSTANSNRDGSGAVATVLAAGSAGSRVDFCSIKAVGTCTDGMIRFYIHDGSTGRLVTEAIVTATTPAANVKTFETMIEFMGGILLPATYSLRASTQQGEQFNITAFGGDL